MTTQSGGPQSLYGTNLFGESAAPKPSGVVAGKFGYSPFTVLDARSGGWQERKRAWLALGMRSEAGRANSLTMSAGKWKGRRKQSASGFTLGNTSIFDPALCELIYRWFSPDGGQVVDPFAGGSVRGIVASHTGRRYWGCDLRAEQVTANREQGLALCPGGMPPPAWVCGDSMDTLATAPAADLIFSCPPYGDLEVYSDDPADLSAMEWHTFVAAYKRIILRAVDRLKADRFACFVVGDFRDAKGFYRNFVSETIAGFEACGARLYNEAILVTSVCSAAMRVTNQFETSRKMAKTHQNVLVFCKGDPRVASAACSAIYTGSK